MKFIFLILITLIMLVYGDNFYEILGISKQASEREIRKAFKNKALKLHPDKNKDDPDAQIKFIELNRAYEVLKDSELRNKYDLYGEKGLEDYEHRGSNYHSWNYYHENFGIYDDDVEIITLNNAEFEKSVLECDDIWFINFYHPMCSHCHTLAPVWRKIAQELEGVVRIGAVNCDDAYHLCSSQGIRSYPTLIAYPKREIFKEEKTPEKLSAFILKKVNFDILITLTDLDQKFINERCEEKPWLIIAKDDQDDNEEFLSKKIKLSAIMEKLVCVSDMDCSKSTSLCLFLDVKAGAKFFKTKEDLLKGIGEDLYTSDIQELAQEVLSLLPNIPNLPILKYKEMRDKLKNGLEAASWLIVFTNENNDENLEIKKLPAYLPSLSLGAVKCEEMKNECDELYISKTPAFLLFKPGGGYEMHQGRSLALDIAAFARRGSLSNNFQILTPKEFPKVLEGGSLWFVDFYAPWCPPCISLLPEFQKASRLLDVPVRFGSIDCTTHSSLCQEFNIHQYPTIIFYNKSMPHEYQGPHTASRLAEFVKDTLSPAVIVLDATSYYERVEKKSDSELWVVDYFANWCSHCVQMAPEYHRFARLMQSIKNVFIAQIDCAQYRHVCQKESISGYPTIKLYPFGFSGTHRYEKYNRWNRDAESFRQWVHGWLPSQVVALDDRTFEEILRGKDPWLIDFFAPWCGHCHQFAPIFEEIAMELEGRLKFGKFNCESFKWVCKSAGVRAYPTVKFYPGIEEGMERQFIEGVDTGTLDREELLSFSIGRIQVHPGNDMKRSRDEL